MKYKNFDEFLQEKCFEENPSVLDDDMPDFYDDWTPDVADVIEYADMYAEIVKRESFADGITEANQNWIKTQELINKSFKL